MRYHRNVYVILVSWSLLMFGSGLSLPYLPNFIKMVCGREASIGLCYAINNIILALLAPIGGVIGDAYGRRKITVYMTWLLAFSYILLIFARTPLQVYLFFILQGIVTLYAPNVMTILMDSLRSEERMRGLFLVNTVSRLVSLPAPLIGGFLIAKYLKLKGYRLVFTITFLLAAIAAAIRTLYLVETLTSKNPIRVSIVSIYKSLMVALRNIRKIAFEVYAISVVEGFAVGIRSGYLIRYAMIRGFTTEEWGIATTISNSIADVGGLMLSYKRKEPRRLLYLVSGLGFKGFGVLIFLYPDIRALTLGLTLLSIGTLTYSTALTSYFMDNVPIHYRSRGEAVRRLLTFAANAVGNVVGAILFEVSSMFTLMFSAFLTLILGLIYCLVNVRNIKRI